MYILPTTCNCRIKLRQWMWLVRHAQSVHPQFSLLLCCSISLFCYSAILCFPVFVLPRLYHDWKKTSQVSYHWYCFNCVTMARQQTSYVFWYSFVLDSYLSFLVIYLQHFNFYYKCVINFCCFVFIAVSFGIFD